VVGRALVAAFLVLAAVSSVLLIGGTVIAPALTVGTLLVGRTVPGGMLNEAYTWAITISVGASAAGGAIAGAVVDQPGGVPWGFLFAATAVAVGAVVAAFPVRPAHPRFRPASAAPLPRAAPPLRAILQLCRVTKDD
jgi:hypothetical protein